MDEKQLLKTALFKGMDKDELGQSLHALHARERHFDKGETILHVGRSTHEMGLVLSGSVRIESLDEMGNRTILNLIVPGQYFAEAYALLGNEPTLVEVAANEPTRILFLDLQNLKPGSCRCGGVGDESSVQSDAAGCAEKSGFIQTQLFHIFQNDPLPRSGVSAFCGAEKGKPRFRNPV